MVSGKPSILAWRTGRSDKLFDHHAYKLIGPLFSLGSTPPPLHHRSVPKLMTTSEAETKRQQAIEFLRRIGNHDDAERFEAMDARDYAEHKGAQISEKTNRRKGTMPQPTGPTKSDLTDTLSQIADLAEEALDPELTREELVSKVKELSDLATGESDEEDEDEDDSSSDSDDDDLD
jgi:hypothetical protein